MTRNELINFKIRFLRASGRAGTSRSESRRNYYREERGRAGRIAIRFRAGPRDAQFRPQSNRLRNVRAALRPIEECLTTSSSTPFNSPSDTANKCDWYSTRPGARLAPLRRASGTDIEVLQALISEVKNNLRQVHRWAPFRRWKRACTTNCSELS
jgi:hypothetical protein